MRGELERLALEFDQGEVYDGFHGSFLRVQGENIAKETQCQELSLPVPVAFANFLVFRYCHFTSLAVQYAT